MQPRTELGPRLSQHSKIAPMIVCCQATAERAERVWASLLAIASMARAADSLIRLYLALLYSSSSSQAKCVVDSM